MTIPGMRPVATVMLVVMTITSVAVQAAASAATTPSHVATTATTTARNAPRVIIDTDLSRWWDDVTALGMANVLQQRGKLKILGIVSDVPNRVAVAAIDGIDTAYGHGDIPLGAVAHSASDTFEHGYTDELVRRLKHSVDSSADVPGAVTLYRRLLAHQPDHSVTIVLLGGYTNVAGLLDSPGGRALIAKKTNLLVSVDGLFPTGGGPFTNQQIDLAAANQVVGGAGWPAPIAWGDGTIGIATRVGASLCTTVGPNHPMRIAYEALFGCGPPKDGDWDGPTLLYAVGDLPDAFTELGKGGAAVINAQGGLSWQDGSVRTHDVYLHVADQASLNQRIDELLAAR